MRINVKEVEIAKAVQKLNKLAEVSKIDAELAHSAADRVLVEFVYKIGLVEIAKAYDLIDK